MITRAEPGRVRGVLECCDRPPRRFHRGRGSSRPLGSRVRIDTRARTDRHTAPGTARSAQEPPRSRRSRPQWSGRQEPRPSPLPFAEREVTAPARHSWRTRAARSTTACVIPKRVCTSRQRPPKWYRVRLMRFPSDQYVSVWPWTTSDRTPAVLAVTAPLVLALCTHSMNASSAVFAGNQANSMTRNRSRCW